VGEIIERDPRSGMRFAGAAESALGGSHVLHGVLDVAQAYLPANSAALNWQSSIRSVLRFYLFVTQARTISTRLSNQKYGWNRMKRKGFPL
jgi:hypothetical protein